MADEKKRDDEAHLLIGSLDFGWMNDEPELAPVKPEVKVESGIDPVELPTASAPSDIDIGVLYPWLKPPIRKRRGVRRSPNSNNLPHLKAKIAAIKGRSGSSTGADVVQPNDGQAGPSNSKRPKPDQLAVPANDVQFEARVEGGAVEGGDGEEEEERIITTRRGPIVYRAPSIKSPKRATLKDMTGWNKRLAEIETHREVHAARKKSVYLEKPETISLSDGQTVELQKNHCLSQRYKAAPRCTQCMAKLSGDSCRFRSLRFFPVNPDTGRLAGEPFFGSSPTPHPTYTWPVEFNVDPQGKGSPQRLEARRSVAQALVPVLLVEYNHASNPDFIRRAIAEDDLDQRLTCDHCKMTIFTGVWICRCCGREYCFACYEIFPKESEPAKSDTYPRLTRCTRTAQHRPIELLRVGLWEAETIRNLLVEILEFCIEQDAMKLPSLSNSLSDRLYQHMVEGFRADQPRAAELRERRLQASRVEDVYGGILKTGHFERRWNREQDGQSLDPVDPSGVASLPFFVFEAGTLGDESQADIFVEFWKRRHFILLHGALNNFKLDWSASQFVQQFGETLVDVIDSESGEKKEMNLAEFFEPFGNYADRTSRWKVKDWPQNDSFSTTAPDLYTDLTSALPMPSSTRLDGVRNLAAYSALDAPSPDLGPKLYAAYASVEGRGNGTTRLHMDMTDAINIMVHAEATPDGRLGCAAWDIFPSESSDLIKEYLRETQTLAYSVEDPIHCHRFYLDAAKRRDLFEKKNVRSTRIYQYKGDAVFIPAGCAHQVCNLADAIKVALDFASPENISTCQQLTSEFRAMSLTDKIRPWKEDVLSLNNMMLAFWRHSGNLQREASLVPSLPHLSSPDATASTGVAQQSEAGPSTSTNPVTDSSASKGPSSSSRDPQLILDIIEDWAARARTSR